MKEQVVPKSAQLYIIAGNHVALVEKGKKIFYKQVDGKWFVWEHQWDPNQINYVWNPCKDDFSFDDNQLSSISLDGILYWLDPIPEEENYEDPYISAEGYIKTSEDHPWGKPFKGRIYVKEGTNKHVFIWSNDMWVQNTSGDPKGAFELFMENHSADNKLYALARNQVDDQPVPKPEPIKPMPKSKFKPYRRRYGKNFPWNSSWKHFPRDVEKIKTDYRKRWLDFPRKKEVEITPASALRNEVNRELPEAAKKVAPKKANVEVNQAALHPGMVVQHVFSKKKFVLISEQDNEWIVEDAAGGRETLSTAVLRVCNTENEQESDIAGWAVFIIVILITFVLLSQIWFFVPPPAF